MMDVERAVSRVLLLGGSVAVTLMLLGLLALEVRAARTAHPLDIARVVENRAAGRSADVFVSLPQLGRALVHRPLDPVAVITVGVVVLLGTPSAALIAALAGFLRAGERGYAAVGAALLLALAGGFLVGVG